MKQLQSKINNTIAESYWSKSLVKQLEINGRRTLS